MNGRTLYAMLRDVVCGMFENLFLVSEVTVRQRYSAPWNAIEAAGSAHSPKPT